MKKERQKDLKKKRIKKEMKKERQKDLKKKRFEERKK